MHNTALTGGFENAPVDSAIAFRACLEAMARPGTLHHLDGGAAPAPCSAAAATALLTLCDAETPVFLAPSHDSPDMRHWLAFHIGASLVCPEEAMFALGTWDSLQPLSRFATGTPEYPDRSATLIIEMPSLSTTGARLSGPGIETHAHLSLPSVAEFQQNARMFPLGWDALFTCGHQLAALPRSTKIEAP